MCTWRGGSQVFSYLQVRLPAVTRRSMPGQAEEEVNQLTYMQKHMPSLLSLLAETTEEGENSTKVSSSIIYYPLLCTMLPLLPA